MDDPKPLKVFIECYPNNMWYEDVGNGTYVVKGEGSWVMWNTIATFPAGIEIVTDLSESSVTHPVVQTVADGKVDVVVDNFVATSDRFAFVDFAYVYKFTETTIFSRSNNVVSGNVIASIFDNTSYFLFGLSLVLAIILVYFALWLSHATSNLNIVDLGLILTGNAVSQPLPRSLHLERVHTSASLLVRLFDLITFLIASMYCSVLISKLTAKHETRPINSLEDLARRSEKILIVEDSFVEDVIDDIPALAKLKDRIDLVDDLKFQMVPLVYEGTHVAIDTSTNFDFKRRYKTNKTACQYEASDFRAAQEPVISQPVTWLFNKNSTYKETINKYNST